MNSALDLEALQYAVDLLASEATDKMKPIAHRAQAALSRLRQPRPPESGTGTPPRDLEDAFRAGFHAGYVNADDSYPGPDEDAAFSDYAQKQDGKDQGLTASPLLRQKVRNLLEACNSLDRSEESKRAMYEAAAEVESVLSGEPASGEPSNPNPIPQVPAPLPVEPATAPLTWTKEKPKVEGWYWMRRGQLLGIRKFAFENGRFQMTGFWGEAIENMPSDAEWAGPIPEPVATPNPIKD